MRQILKKILYKLFYKIGYYPPQKVNSPEVTVQFLSRQPAMVQIVELKRISTFYAFIDNHIYYNSLLKSLVPTWSKQFIGLTFIGNGIGQNSLNSFRKCDEVNNSLFEKVYFNIFEDLNKVIWFQKNISQLLKNKITIPNIKEVFRGDLISITYSEFIELNEVEFINDNILDQIAYTKILFDISLNNNSYLNNLNIPYSIKNFRLHFEYVRNIKHAIKVFEGQSINFKVLESQVEDSLLIITHGDIQSSNIYNTNVLVDWDSFGLFPIGLEISFVYFKLFQEGKISLKPLIWLNCNYSHILNSEFGKELKRNYCYFVFIFFSKYFEDKAYDFIFNDLIPELKS